jgi:hypothetical protein
VKEKKEELKLLMLRLTKKMHKDLRKLSYLSELSMAEIIRTAIDEKLKSNKKILTNSDIAI